MKLTRTSFLVLIAVVALLVSIPAIVSASSVPPHKFYGTAYIDGQPAPEGTLVVASISDERVGETMADATGNYVLTTMGDSSYQGQVVTFRVNGQYARETAIWLQGARTELDLNASSAGDAGSPNVPPHAFGGQVTIDGNTASGGVEIAAIIEGGTVATAFTSSDGKYKLKVQQGTQNFASKTVTFTVDGNMASQLAIWRQGGVDLLDLSAYSGPRPVASVFATLISDGSLVAVWMYHNATQLWAVFDPRPEAAELNDLTEVNTKDIVWVEVSGQRVFQGRTLYQGWNLIAVR